MIESVTGGLSVHNSAGKLSPEPAAQDNGLGLRFEQMFWAEMLSQAGFEQALTRSGGEAVASFSRFLVESIAADLARQHPLGIGDAVTASLEEG